MPKNKDRGDRIRDLREAKGLSQDQLANKIGTTDGSHISKWENGDGISRKYLVKLADALNTTKSYIEHGSQDTYPNNDNTPSVETMIDEYESRKGEKGFSDNEKDLLLEVLLRNAESLSKGLRRLIEIERNRSDA